MNGKLKAGHLLSLEIASPEESRIRKPPRCQSIIKYRIKKRNSKHDLYRVTTNQTLAKGLGTMEALSNPKL